MTTPIQIHHPTISIHAPLTGCDPHQTPKHPKNEQFQSTHPSRGATFGGGFFQLVFHHFNPRTPHGVRPSSLGSSRFDGYFNPRTPHGVRRQILPKHTPKAQFQSTHPSRGATYMQKVANQLQIISIHAPLTGCDYLKGHEDGYSAIFQSTHPSRGATSCRTWRLPRFGDFNPRTPHGVRPA